jgi:hypothetical protein
LSDDDDEDSRQGSGESLSSTAPPSHSLVTPLFKSELNPLNVPFVSDTSAMADGDYNYMTPQLMSPHQIQQLQQQQQQSTFQTLQPLAPFPQVAAAAGNVLMMNQAMGYFFSCPITLAQPPQNTFATYPPAHPVGSHGGLQWYWHVNVVFIVEYQRTPQHSREVPTAAGRILAAAAASPAGRSTTDAAVPATTAARVDDTAGAAASNDIFGTCERQFPCTRLSLTELLKWF